MSDCLFCQIIAGNIPSSKVYEDDQFIAFLDINPVNPGHTLLIPKDHCDRFTQTPPQLVSQLIGVGQMLTKAILKSVNAPAANVSFNNGAEAGQVIFHTHLHIIPRFKDDNHKMWQGKPYKDDNQMNDVANAIRIAQD